MSSFTNNNQPPLAQKRLLTKAKDLEEKDDCLLCKLLDIRNEKAKIVNWVLSGDQSSSDKANLATELTGIDFDSELIDCLKEPAVRNLLLSE